MPLSARTFSPTSPFSCSRPSSPPSPAPVTATSATSISKGTDENRFEREPDDFYRRIYAKYEEIAARDSNRVYTIVDEAPIHVIEAKVAAIVASRIQQAARKT